VAQLKGANGWNIHNFMERMADQEEDPWAEYWRTRQTITADMHKRLGLK
jgi:bifunctional non-homologous end joining protein LigD